MMPMWPVLRRHRRAAIALVALAPFVLIVVVINTIAGHGSSPQSAQVELPFIGLHLPEGVAVDFVGNVYITDEGSRRVLKLQAGSNTQVELPFTGLHDPWGVAVDTDGNVYIADDANNRVLKLPAR